MHIVSTMDIQLQVKQYLSGYHLSKHKMLTIVIKHGFTHQKSATKSA